MENNSIVLDLLWPPSVNRLWRTGNKRIYRSKKYDKWERDCMFLTRQRRWKPIKGEFNIEMIFHRPDNRKRDLDNLVKATMDFCQKCGAIENDYLCQSLNAHYGAKSDAPMGARIVINPVL